MKKFSWILALLAALAMVFVGCSDGGGSKKEVDLTKPDTVLEGADITLVKIGQETKHSVEGNKYTIAEGSPSGNRVGSAGFGYAFTEEQSEYKYVKLEAKITAIDEDSCAAFTIKKSTQMNDLAGFGGNSSPQYSRNGELNLGDKVGDTAKASEMKGDTFVSDQFLVSLFSGGIYFQFNSYAGYWSNMDGDDLKDPMPDWMDLDIDAKLMGNQSFTVEVTKITFTNGGTPSPDMDLTAEHFTVGNSKQYKDKNEGVISAVTVTPVGGIDVGAISIFYKDTYETAVPQTVGTHKVFIDVAGAAGYKAATKLEVGALIVEATSPLYAYELDMTTILPGGSDGDTIAEAAIAPLTTRGPTPMTLSIIDDVRGIRLAITNGGYHALLVPLAAVGSFDEGDTITVTGILESTGNNTSSEVMINIGDWNTVGGNASVADGATFTRTGSLTSAQADLATEKGFIQIRVNSPGGGSAMLIIETIVYDKN